MTPLDDSTAAPASRRRRVAVAVIALCAVAAIALWPEGDAAPLAAPTATATATATTATAASTTVAPPAAAPATTPAAVTPVADPPAEPAAVEPTSPVQVRVPAVDIAASVIPTAFQDGSIDPPTFGEAYWIEAYGAPDPEADNTVYLVGHSWSKGDAVFNPLFDRDAQTSEVAPGDEVIVTTPKGDVAYEIERTERYPKASLGDSDSDAYGDVWKVVPGRLVLITCFQRNDGGASQDNFVVYATVKS